jgi:ABC-type bacteriocin/lantibiotic exporter with double-glycine peptidase domain
MRAMNDLQLAAGGGGPAMQTTLAPAMFRARLRAPLESNSRTGPDQSLVQIADQLQRLLLRRGLRLSLPQITPSDAATQVDAEAWMQSAREVLDAQHVPCRLVRADRTQLRALALPTLVVRADGKAAIVQVIRRRVVCELEDQRMVLLNAWLPAADETVLALDFGAALPTGMTWVRCLLAGLAMDQRRVCALLCAAVAAQALALVGPIVTWLIAGVALPDGASRLLTVVALGLVVITLQGALLGWWRDRLMRAIDTRLQLNAAAAAFGQLIRLPYALAARREVGVSLQLVASVERTVSGVLRTGITTLVDLPSMIVAWAVLCWMLPVAALSVALVACALIGLSVPLARNTAAYQTREVEARAAQQSSLYELITGATTLRVAGAEHAGTRRWLRRLIDEQSAALGQVRSGLWLDLLFEGAHRLSTVAILVWGAHACLAGNLDVGALLAAAMLADQFMGGALRVGHGCVALYTLRPHVHRVTEAFAQPVEKTATHRRPAARERDSGALRGAAAVVVQDLWFRYSEESAWAVAGCNLQLAPGAMVSLRGRSGAGKTTLMRMIAGLLEPTRGSIFVYGRAPHEASELMAYLPQDAQLFEGTIASNLKWLSQATQSRIDAVACATGLDAWVRSLPLGYATPLPPGAANLSGGQRQWIALTGVLASDRPLLLLDEALSHMDRLTRERVLACDAFNGKSVLMITHERRGPLTGGDA